MKVLVTGANGHLGYILARQLIEAGHRVRGSLRGLSDPQRTARLRALGDIELVEADVTSRPALRAAMAGMDWVCHCAAVYALHAPGREREIIDASVIGAERAIEAAHEAGVGKVVMTSSVVAVPLTAPGAPPSTEADWASDLRVPYIRAKTEGERRAWQVAGRLGVKLVTILPGAFGGSGFQRSTPTIDFIQSIMRGALEVAAPALNYPYVDVRDVARAHRLALEKDCSGRFLAVADRMPTMAEIAEAMHRIDPAIPRPKFTLPRAVIPLLPLLDQLNAYLSRTPRSMSPDLAATLSGGVWNASNERIRRELGWAPDVSLEESLADTIAAIKARRVRPT